MRWLRLMRLLLVYRKQVEEYKQAALDASRACLDLAVTFRIAMERPEVDLRDTLDVLIRDLQDQVAVMEEHL